MMAALGCLVSDESSAPLRWTRTEGLLDLMPPADSEQDALSRRHSELDALRALLIGRFIVGLHVLLDRESPALADKCRLADGLA